MPFNEFTPKQFGIKGTYGVMQFNRTFYNKHRAAVADFMRADLKALAFCIAHKVAVREVGVASGRGRATRVPHSRTAASWRRGTSSRST